MTAHDSLLPTAQSAEWERIKPPSEMSLIEIAQHLERVTSWIEAERSKARVAKDSYQNLAEQAESRIERIKELARSLLQEQRRRLKPFESLCGIAPAPPAPERLGQIEAKPSIGGRLSITQAILAIWSLPGVSGPLSTEEIAEGLIDVGYESKAAPRSMKSALNQALAKLCHEGAIRKYRTDGTPIPPEDTVSRARKYLPADLADRAR